MARRREGEHSSHNNLTVGILFCLFVIVLLVGSFSLKLFDLLRRSAFNGSERFTIAVSTPRSSEVKVISLAPKEANAYILSVPRLYRKGETTRVVTAQNVSTLIALPVDGAAIPKTGHDIEFSDDNEIDGVFQTLLFNYPNISTNLTVLDLGRLYLLSKTIPQSSIQEAELEATLEDGEIDKTVQSLFVDERVVSEKMSIEILNGTQVGGLGNRMARSVVNMGGNVVVVASSPQDLPVSEIYYSTEKSYTAEKLSDILNFPLVEVKENGISDIIIRIGKDKVEKLNL